MLIAKNGTQYNQITNEIIKAHATYVNSPFVKVERALNYRIENGRSELIDDFTPEELKAGLTEIAKIANAETRELYINKFFSNNKLEAQQIITRTLANKETYNKTEVNNLLNAKANQSTTYNKDQVNNLLNAKANQATTYNKDQVNHLISSINQATYTKREVDDRIRAYSYSRQETYNRDQFEHLLSSVNQSFYSKREVDDRVNVKANWNAIVNLNGNQIINGVKTFTSPVIVHNATADNHAVNLFQIKSKADINYVKKRGGFVIVDRPQVDLNLGINFQLNLSRPSLITVFSANANIGQTGEIYVPNGHFISAFSSPFDFRVATSGFGANEVFSYLVVSANLVRITRS